MGPWGIITIFRRTLDAAAALSMFTLYFIYDLDISISMKDYQNYVGTFVTFLIFILYSYFGHRPRIFWYR